MSCTAVQDSSEPNVENNKRVVQFMDKVSDFQPEKYGIGPESVLYEAGCLCTVSKLRQLKIGSRLIENSLDMAKKAGAQYYKVIVVNTFAKKIFDKYGFETINTVRYADLFKGDKCILDKIDPLHQEAWLLYKKL